MTGTEPHVLPPTSRWLAELDGVLPPHDGPVDTATRLLLLLHYGIDWEAGWVAGYRETYWAKQLPDRVLLHTFGTDSLRAWWNGVSLELGSRPGSHAQRLELDRLLRTDPLPVLEILRTETAYLVNFTQLVASLRSRARRDAMEAAR